MKLQITHFQDSDGNKLVAVPLTNVDNKAILYESDFDKLLKLGIDPRWRFTVNQVFERGKARVSIARLIRNAGLKESVRYLDKDPCNLRTENLVICPGGGRYGTTERLNPETRPTRVFDKVELEHKNVLPSWKTGLPNARI